MLSDADINYERHARAAVGAVISPPCAPAASGLPIGLQLVAPFGADAQLCAVAAQFERAQPWADRWPALAAEGTQGAATAG